MNPPRCDEMDYIQFLIAAQRTFTCTEAARCQPDGEHAPAHDAFTRLLQRRPPDTEALWQEVQGVVRLLGGALVLDYTTLDKPHAHKMDLVTRHWSGRHRQVVLGINLLTLLWTDAEAHLPCDFLVYDKPFGGQTKNEHFRDLLAAAKARGFQPRCVLFDRWYASVEHLKAVRGHGVIQVFRIVAPDGDVEHWATSEVGLPSEERETLGKWAWRIEAYHRGIKQCCGVEKSPSTNGEGAARVPAAGRSRRSCAWRSIGCRRA